MKRFWKRVYINVGGLVSAILALLAAILTVALPFMAADGAIPWVAAILGCPLSVVPAGVGFVGIDYFADRHWAEYYGSRD